MISAKTFWDWFLTNNNAFFFLNQIEDKAVKEDLLSEFLKKLHEYSNGLFFEIGGYPDEEQELIITAQGNKTYFPKVLELVNEAPKIKNWKIIAFKQPKEPDFITSYNGLELDPQKMWFSPLKNPNNAKALGIKVLINDFNPKKKQEYLFPIQIILDNILGEYSNAENIIHVEIGSLPEDHESKFIKLIELPNYIKWSKKQITNF